MKRNIPCSISVFCDRLVIGVAILTTLFAPTKSNAANSAFMPFNLPMISTAIGLTRQADTAADNGDWKSAQLLYANALAVFPGYPGAMAGFARHLWRVGNVTEALAAYRKSIYAGDEMTSQDPRMLMEYAILLSQSGNMTDAVTAYHLARLATVGDGTASSDSTATNIREYEVGEFPDRNEFQAMAYIGATLQSETSEPWVINYLTYAVKLDPVSALPHFHLAQRLKEAPGRESDAADEFHKAYQFGDSDMQSRVLTETKWGSSTFKAAFKSRFYDVPAAPNNN